MSIFHRVRSAPSPLRPALVLATIIVVTTPSLAMASHATLETGLEADDRTRAAPNTETRATPIDEPGAEPSAEAQVEAPGQEEAEPGSELRVWLVTAGPGDAVWERYGHNAIRVLDTRTGRDVSYNWGIFDFQQVDFIPRFLQGRMLYMMAPFSTPAMIDAYARADREVTLQELDLTPAQKLELRTLAEINALPENRDYVYQYFLDNCSTRVRDLLDSVLDGRLLARFGNAPTGTSYRYHTRRLTQVDPLIYTGMDLLLGTPTDQPLTVWEEMFLPLSLRDEIRNLEVERADGGMHPLVLSEEITAHSTRPPAPQEPPAWLPLFGLLGVGLGGLFASLSAPVLGRRVWLRRLAVLAATLWSALGGVAGVILVLLLFTDHTFAWWNENLFLVHPVLLVLTVLLPFIDRDGVWLARARAVAGGVVVLALAGALWQLAPPSEQANAVFFALILPGHLGLWWGLSRMEAPPGVDSGG